MSVARKSSAAWLWFCSCLFAGLVPFWTGLNAPPTTATQLAAEWPGWPTEMQGKPLRPLTLSAREARFAQDFPGKLGRFTDGEREIIIRWVTQPTRTLHPASDCFKGLGYQIEPRPINVDQHGHHWSSFLAKRAGESLLVTERIYRVDASASWTDVSSWYWYSLWQGQAGACWAVTIAATE